MIGIGEMYAAGLLGELNRLVQSQSQRQLNRRALRVYNRCMRNGHPFIAQKIADKYPEAVNIKSDAAMAFGMAMMAQKNKL
jgi:hypothetical protein